MALCSFSNNESTAKIPGIEEHADIMVMCRFNCCYSYIHKYMKTYAHAYVSSKFAFEK